MKIYAYFLLGLIMVESTAFGIVYAEGKQDILNKSDDEQLRIRLRSEIEFCENLSKLYPDNTKEWQQLINQAKKIAEQADNNCYDTVVSEAEKILAPIGKVAKTYTIHCVGHAHIDMNWMWSWHETIAIVNDTFTTVLKLMDEFPDFCFSQSQASVYEIIKEHNPELFEKIKQRVSEGRWEITATEWVEGDKNIVSGESLARHQIYTRQFIKDNFDLAAEEVSLCWNPDTFGHAYTIPTILSRAGVKRYYLCRDGGGHKNREKHSSVFWWEGPDGSRIPVFSKIYQYQ